METDKILLIDQCHNLFYVPIRLLVHFLCYCSWIFLLEMDRFFPSAMTPSCWKFPAVTHEFDVCQKMNRARRQTHFQWIRQFGTSSQLEVVLYSHHCFLWLSKKRNNKHVRTLVTNYWLFFLALLIRSNRWKFVFCHVVLARRLVPHHVDASDQEPKCAICYREETLLKFFFTYIYLWMFNKEYICYMRISKIFCSFLCSKKESTTLHKLI